MRALLAAAVLAVPAAAAYDGPALFDAHGCRSCHRVGHKGGDAGPDLTTVGHRRPKAWLDRWLKSPRSVEHDALMPEQGLSTGDRGALVDFLAAQKGQAWRGARPFTDGRAIFNRAGCVACHGPEGRGGESNPGAHGGVIPALAPLMATYTAAELKRKIKAGVVPETHGGPPAETVMPPWGEVLSEPELDLLAAYLLSLASKKAEEW